MTEAGASQQLHDNLLRLIGAIMCKTHRWFLIIQKHDGMRWASSGVNFAHGEQAPVDELFKQIATYDIRNWAFHAVTEPALTEDEAVCSLDLLVPMRAGAMSEAVTPSMIVQTYLKFAACTAEIMDYKLRLRGFQSMAPQEFIRAVQFPKSKVAQNGLLLCHTLDINRKIEAAYHKDMAVWFSRGLLELYPFHFYQRLVGNVNGYAHYCVGAPDGLADAELLMQRELSTLEAYMETENALSKDDALYRALSPDKDLYVDTYSRASAVSMDNCSMLKLDKRYMILSCVPSLSPYHDITVDDNSTKRLLFAKHKEDALAPLLEQCEKGLE